MKYITYYRVSTRKQDLGLEAQRTIIEAFLSSEDVVINEVIEKETGTNKKVRAGLERAIELAKETGATLLIAKLDRLARNVHFISTLMEGGVEFKALDMPEANRLTIHIFAAMAEHEATLISTRTKAALAELKKKGVKLGNQNNLTDEGRSKGRKVHEDKAKENPHTKQARAYAVLLKEKGMNYSQIAKELNELEYKTARGKRFYPVQVQRLLK